MNWDDVRIFLAIYRAGTLRGAADRLQLDQTTVGRRLNALEQLLGSKLYLRSRQGLVITAAGQKIVATAEEIERLAVSFERRGEGVDDRPEGEVHVTTTDSLAVDFVLPAIEQVQRNHPGIAIKLTTTTRLLDLDRREADIAVRTVRPTQPDLIVRKLASWPVGLFATQPCLDRFGLPQPGTGLLGHRLALYQPGVTQYQDGLVAGEPRHNAQVVAELDSSLMLTAFIRAGHAMGELPVYLSQRYPELIRVWPERSRKKAYEAWLVMHQDLAHTARIKIVMKFLVEAFSRPLA